MRKWLGRLLKTALAALILLAAAAALSPWILRRWLPPEKVCGLIVANARKTLRREVRLGEISYGLLRGLTLSDFAVSESPDFTAGTFASVRSFRVRLRWLPLLRRQVVLDSIAAEGLSVAVVRLSADAYNFSDLLSAAAAKGAQASGPSGGSFDLRIRKAQISGGEFRYRDRVSAQEWRLSQVEAKAGHFRLDGPFALEASLKAAGRSGGRAVEVGLSYLGKVDLAGGGAVDVKRLVVDSQGWRLEASGKARGFDKPEVDAEFSAAQGGASVVSGRFSGRVWPPSKDGPLSARGELAAQTPGLRAADLQALGGPKLALPALKASARFDYGGDKVALADLAVQGGFGELRSQGSVGGLSSGKLVLGLDFSARLSLPAFSSGDVPWAKLPAGLSVPALSLSAKGRLKDDDLTLSALNLKTAAGTVDVAGSASRVSSGKPALDLDVAVNLELPQLKSADLAWAKLDPGYVSPAMDLAGKFHVKGDDLSIAALHVKAKAGTADLSGMIRKALAGAPQPDLTVRAKLDLPPLKSADLPLSSVPSGLSIPATRWDVDAQGGLDEVKIRHLRLNAGHNDLEIADAHVAGLRSGAPLFSVLFKCRSFDLGEMTQFSESTREIGLTGNGFFAVEVTGKWPKPILAGKMKFQGLGGTVAGLKLADFTGTASFNEKRIDIPKLTGKMADGTLEMDLTVKNYATSPAIDLQASLDRFDLGGFLAAKSAMSAKSAASPQSAAKPASAQKPPAPIDAKGRLAIGQLQHPNAQASDVRIDWDLEGLTPDLRSLGGSASFKVAGGGRFSQLGQMALQSKLVKVLLFPLMVFQKIGKVGGIQLFPDFNNVVFRDLAGDYAFENGVMSLRDSHLDSDAATVSAKGSINLPAEALNLVVTAQVGSVAPIDVDVKGTFDNPATHAHVGKFIADPAKQLIQNLFHKEEQVPAGAPIGGQ